jgi:hypothetical protein
VWIVSTLSACSRVVTEMSRAQASRKPTPATPRRRRVERDGACDGVVLGSLKSLFEPRGDVAITGGGGVAAGLFTGWAVKPTEPIAASSALDAMAS